MGTNAKKKRRIFRQILVVILVASLIATGVYGYFAWAAEASKIGAVFMSSDGKKSKEFRLEVAADDRSRAMGLMWRKELKENEGMLFVHVGEANHTFWMRNTYIPLDMVFVDKDFKVVGILENVPVLNESPRSINTKSQFIIELNAGSAAKDGIKVGHTVSFDKPLPQAK